mgnify:CR=1 FL=1
MSSITYYQYTRLSDSLERNLMRDALSCNEPVSIIAVVKNVFSKAKEGFIDFMDFCAEVNQAMSEARARSSFYAGSQW